MAGSVGGLLGPRCSHGILEDTSFTYLLHPATGMPIFAEPRDDVSCFHAAQQEMVRLRTGLGSELLRRNDTLNAMLAGLHPRCGADVLGGVACPATWWHR